MTPTQIQLALFTLTVYGVGQSVWMFFLNRSVKKAVGSEQMQQRLAALERGVKELHDISGPVPSLILKNRVDSACESIQSLAKNMKDAGDKMSDYADSVQKLPAILRKELAPDFQLKEVADDRWRQNVQEHADFRAALYPRRLR